MLAKFVQSISGQKILGFYVLIIIGAVALFTGNMTGGVFAGYAVPLYATMTAANVMNKKVKFDAKRTDK